MILRKGAVVKVIHSMRDILTSRYVILIYDLISMEFRMKMSLAYAILAAAILTSQTVLNVSKLIGMLANCQGDSALLLTAGVIGGLSIVAQIGAELLIAAIAFQYLIGEMFLQLWHKIAAMLLVLIQVLLVIVLNVVFDTQDPTWAIELTNLLLLQVVTGVVLGILFHQSLTSRLREELSVVT